MKTGGGKEHNTGRKEGSNKINERLKKDKEARKD